MHTNEIALRALINKLLDTTRRSNLLKFPTTTNRGSIKIDLGLSLNEFLQILSFQNQNILSIDQLNWEVPYSKYSLVDKYCKNKDLGLFKEEMSEEIPELITNFKLDFKPGTKFNISDCLRELLSKSKLNNKEKGVHSLFLASGFLKWVDDGNDFYAPLVLVPVDIIKEGNDFRIMYSESGLEIQLNPSLFFKYNCQNELGRDINEVMRDIDNVRDKLIESMKAIKGVEKIQFYNSLRIANYAISPLWKITLDNIDGILNHPVTSVMVDGNIDFEEYEESNFSADTFIGGKDDFTIIDADDSQLEVINRAMSGENLVITGAPGTGKSQTIVNLISNLIAKNKKVLFVCEKKVALDVVFEKLSCVELNNSLTLADYCLDLGQSKLRIKNLSSSIISTYNNRVQINQQDTAIFDNHQLIPKYYTALEKKLVEVSIDNQSVDYKTAVGWLEKHRLEGVNYDSDLLNFKVESWNEGNYEKINQLINIIEINEELFTDTQSNYWAELLTEDFDKSNVEEFSKTIRKQYELIGILKKSMDSVDLNLNNFDEIEKVASNLSVQNLPLSLNFDEFVIAYNKFFEVQNRLISQNISEILDLNSLEAHTSEIKFLSIDGASLNLENTLIHCKEYLEIENRFQLTNTSLLDSIQSVLGDYTIEFVLFLKDIISENEYVLGILSNLLKLINYNNLSNLGRLINAKKELEEEISKNNEKLSKVFKLPKAVNEIKEIFELKELIFDQKYNNPISLLFDNDYKKNINKLETNFYITKIKRSRIIEDVSDLKEYSELQNNLTQIKSQIKQIFGGSIDNIIPTNFTEFLNENQRLIDLYGIEINKVFQVNNDYFINAVHQFTLLIGSTKYNQNQSIVASFITFLKLECQKANEKYNIIENIKLITNSNFFHALLKENSVAINTKITQINNLLSDFTKVKRLYKELGEKTLDNQEILDNTDSLTSKFVNIQNIQKSVGDKLDKFTLVQMKSLCDFVNNDRQDGYKIISDIRLQSKNLQKFIVKDIESLDMSKFSDLICDYYNNIDTLINFTNKKKFYQDATDLGISDLVKEFYSKIQNKKTKLSDFFKFNFYNKVVEHDDFKSLKLLHTDMKAQQSTFRQKDIDLFSVTNKKRLLFETKLVGNSYLKERTTLDRYAEMANGPRISLKQFFSDNLEFIQKVKPVMLCNPINLACFFKFDVENYEYDTIIFDEASQITTQAALLAIARAEQVIIFGDQHQLSPSTLFAGVDDNDYTDEELDLIENNNLMESMGRAMPVTQKVHLKYHYRSKYGNLIKFINNEVYSPRNNYLNYTFNSNSQLEKLSTELIYEDDGVYKNQSNEVEIQTIIKNCIEVFLKHPKKSLGVIVFNSAQEEKLRDAIFEKLNELSQANNENYDKIKEGFDELSDINSHNFFIKNTENVQGDERDIIIISTVYGKNVEGRVMQNFGYLTRQNSYKRLNVILTRAKERVIFITSLKSTDITAKNEGTASTGKELLRRYLSKLEKIDTETQDPQLSFESPFEESVYESILKRLDSSLYRIDTQVNESNFRIDLAILDKKTGNYLLGIECDGVTYHTGASVRFKDRFRQNILESRGWKIIRIWSFDWNSDKESQVTRVLCTLDKLIISSL